MDTHYGWAIVGTGDIAGEMAEAIRAEGSRLVAVSGTSLTKAEDFAAKHGAERACSDLEELLSADGVDVVYIATPHASHHEIMKAALEAGKHVLAEKSITVNLAQLDECIEIASGRGLVICDGTTLLHMPLFAKLRRMVDAGELGKVTMIQVNFGSAKTFDPNDRLFDPAKAGGALLDIGVYALSFVRWFMSCTPDLVLSTAALGASGVDETSGIVLRNGAGEMGVVSLTFQAKQPKRGIVSGTKGYFEVTDYPRADAATFVHTASGRVHEIREGDSAKALRYEVADMESYISDLAEGGEAAAANLEIVRDVMQIMTGLRADWDLVYPGE